jgi:hypothetical protein
MCIEGGQRALCATFVLRNAFAANAFALSVTPVLILRAKVAEAFIANFYGRDGRTQENAQG